jgi:hypothetical protein
MHFDRNDMKGMDMMAARVAMPFDAEQANVLQAPSVSSDGKGMSFAKSFGEIAAGVAGTTPAEQMPKGNATPLSKGAEAPAGSIEKLMNLSADDGLKKTSTPTSTLLAKSGDAGVGEAQSVFAQSSEKFEDAPQAISVVARNVAHGDASLQTTGIDISHGASPLLIEKLIGPSGNVAGDQEFGGTKIDYAPVQSAFKVAQSLLTGEDQPFGEKKEVVPAVSTGRPNAEKTTKKELKEKVNSASAKNATNVPTPVEEPGMQSAMIVPVGVVPLVVTKAQAASSAAEGNPNASVVAGSQVLGSGGAKTAKINPYGVDRGGVVTSASVVLKDGTVVAGKTDDGVSGAKKNEMGSSKTIASTASMNGLNEGTTHGSGEIVAVPIAHGVLALTGNIVVDTVAAKTSADTNSISMADRQAGANQGATGVSESHRTLEATSTSLEVGVANGTQGWLKIRAEMTDSGVVNASVSATTLAGQEMLHRELPSLTAYLHQEQIGVGSLVLHTTAATGSQESGGGMERDARREQMQQRGGQEEESKQDASGTTFSDSGETYVQGGLSGIAEITTNTVYAGGSWLSVRA